MNDETTELATVRAEPAAVAASSEESEATALVAELSSRMTGVRILAPSRTDVAAREALREELARMVATCQQLDAHLAETERAEREAETAEAFTDWATAPGGEER